MTTIYGPTPWDVYARLDGSLDPRGPETAGFVIDGILRKETPA
jgi:hypothetical protein